MQPRLSDRVGCFLESRLVTGIISVDWAKDGVRCLIPSRSYWNSLCGKVVFTKPPVGEAKYWNQRQRYEKFDDKDDNEN